MDYPFSLDQDVSYSSLSDLDKLEKAIQNDQCYIRYCTLLIYCTCILGLLWFLN